MHRHLQGVFVVPTHPPTHPGAVDDCDPRGVGRAPVPVSPDAKKYELGADPFCGVVGI